MKVTKAEDSTAIDKSARYKYYYPSGIRDKDVYALYNDSEAMLPHVAMLFGMSMQDVEARRDTQRAAFANESMFLDVISEDGDLVAVSGFRVILGDRAEWGIIVAPAFRRQKVCEEVFEANIRLLQSTCAQCRTVRAATTEANEIMIHFLEKRMQRTGEILDHTWVVFEADIHTLLR